MRHEREAAAVEAAGLDMLVTWEGNGLDAIRTAAPTVFMTVGLGYATHASVPDALAAAYRAVRAGADAIYCPQSLAYVRALADEGIPTVGHVGFVPYKATWSGGFRAVGRTADEARRVFDDAVALREAGAFAAEIEIVPAPLAEAIASRVDLFLVGMGAGSACHAQYLFATDILGDNEGHVPRHAKVYRDHRSELDRLHRDAIAAFSEFAADVRDGSFPEPGHSLTMDTAELDAFTAGLDPPA